jgi:sugar O-acyltransferase (sialic acid O-acetyltransferase NeuD family)
MKVIGLVGAGGFAIEVMPLVRRWLQAAAGQEPSELVFVVEDDVPIKEPTLLGLKVVSMAEFRDAGDERQFNIAIGNSQARARIADALMDVARPFPITASTHVSLEGNEIGEGAIFCNFSHVTSNATIGRFFHCNIYSYVAHNCRIGDFVTFAPSVQCNGHVVVEDHAYIGTGVVIKDASTKPIVIGRGAIIGAGAVVTKSVPAGATVLGNPARLMQRS